MAITGDRCMYFPDQQGYLYRLDGEWTSENYGRHVLVAAGFTLAEAIDYLSELKKDWIELNKRVNKEMREGK